MHRVACGFSLLLTLSIVHPRTEVGAQLRILPRSRTFWLTAGLALTSAALMDEHVRTASLAHQSGALDALADAGNQLGTGRNIIGALALTYVGARVLHRKPLADRVLRIAVGYAVSNGIVSVLKPVVGRHRPDSTNDAWRFNPFSGDGSWHSFSSSHAVHAFSLSAGVAMMSRRPWLQALAYTESSIVAWSRVYDDQHWTSDVTASAVIGIATAATTLEWLDRRFPPPRDTTRGPR